MAIKGKLESRLQELSQKVGTVKRTLPPQSVPFKLPAAYANDSSTPVISSDQPNSTSSALRQKGGSEDERRSKRKPVILTGIVKNDGSSLDVDVLIKDMSMNGVCLALDRDNPNRLLPSQNPYISEIFQLCVPFEKMSVQCRLVWRDGDAFGAVYNSTPQFQR